MTYGLSRRAFIENGPAEQAIEAGARRSRARSWRVLDAGARLAAVETRLEAANDQIDAYPFAL